MLAIALATESAALETTAAAPLVISAPGAPPATIPAPVEFAGTAAAARALELWKAQRSPATRAAYSASLAEFAGWLRAQGFASIDSPAAAAALLFAPGASHAAAQGIALEFRAHLQARIESTGPAKITRATANARLAAIRSAANFAQQSGAIPWTLNVPGFKVRPYRDTRGPATSIVNALLQAALNQRSPAKAARDAAIVRLLHDNALRRGELIALDTGDCIPGDDGRPVAIMVVGKGESEPQRIDLAPPTAAALESWLAARADIEIDSPALFPGLARAGASPRISGRSVAEILEALSRAAGVARVRPHQLRHTSITRALDESGGDLRAAQRHSRHRNLQTLSIYDDSRKDSARAIAAKVAAGLTADAPAQ